MLKFVNDARLRVGASLREMKEKAQERKALKRARELPHGAAPLLWCVLLTLVGVAALAGSTWMLLVFIAGSVGHFDWFSSYVASQDGVSRWEWNIESDVHWHVAIGLFLFCVAIAIFNATWLEARKHLHGAIRSVVTGIGIAVALFMISGAIVVQQRGTDARAQDDAVAIQAAQVDANAARERLETARQTLREMRNHENQYMAVAATVGAAEFERSYLSPQQRARETPERVRLLERSLGAARRADALEVEIAQLERETAQAAVGAAQAQAVTVRAEGFMAAPTAILEDARKPITATLGELLALTAFGFALASWRSRRAARDVQRSGWADESHRIEDLRDEEAIKPQRMKPAREVVTDAETGEELVKVKPKEYWRKRKGKVQKLDVQPEIPPDETGVEYDGGQRAAVTLGGVMELPGERNAMNAEEPQHGPPDPVVNGEQPPSDPVRDADAVGVASSAVSVPVDEAAQPNSSEEQDFIILGDESETAMAADDAADEAVEPAPMIDAEPEQVSEGGDDGEVQEHAEPDHTETPEREEPETRESHMLPNVAAE